MEFLLCLYFSLSTLNTSDSLLIKEYQVIKGDTFITSELNDIEILEFKNQEDELYYNRLKKRTLKVYPYALLASEKLDSIKNDLEKLPNRRSKKKYIKAIEKWGKEDLAKELRFLSRWEGRILCKLIYRETNISLYSIVKDLRGVLHAFFWQTLARFYDNNLKTPYQPDKVEEDKWIEYILQEAKREGKFKKDSLKTD